MNEALKKAAADASDFAKALREPVKDDAGFVFEAKVLKDVWVKWKEAEELHKLEIAELKKQLADKEAKGIMVIGPLRGLAKQLKARLERFAEDRVLEQAKLLNVAAEAALKGRHDEAHRLTIEAEQVLPPPIESIGLGRTFYAEVRDLLKLPDAYLARRPKLADIKRDAKNGVLIPGVEAGHKAVVRVKTKRG